jgi:branched-chain amino acid transport system permease protein
MAMTTDEATAAEVAASKPPRLGNPSRGWAIGFLVLAAAIFALFQWVVPNSSDSVQSFFDNWLPLTTVNQCIVWAMFALGLNIVVGYAGLLDLGYVAFWAIGGYVGAWLMSGFFTQVTINVWGHPAPGQDAGIHINFWLVLPIAGLFCALCGIIIGAPTLRLKSDYLALVTLAFGEIIPEFFRNANDLNGFNLSNGTNGINPVDPIPTGPFRLLGMPKTLGPFDLSYQFLVFCLLIAFLIFVSLRIREGKLGRAWLAIREDELAASMMGVPLMRTKLAAYGVGAFAGGLGGVAYTSFTGGVTSDQFAFSQSIILLAMVVLGGMGNVWGVMVGALSLEWINSTGLSQGGDTINKALGTSIDFPSYNFLIFGAILILMMIFRREGLIPESRTRQVLQEPERGEIESLGAELEGTEAAGAPVR